MRMLEEEERRGSLAGSDLGRDFFLHDPRFFEGDCF
jgi:hypothetical protein